MIDSTQLKHAEITDKILHVFFKKVYHRLGYGFLEKVYENALAGELRRMGLKVERQAKIDVFYGRLTYSMKVRLLVNTSPIFWSKTWSLSSSRHPETF